MITKYVFGHTYALGFVPLFDLDGENNIPTYFSQLLLLAASLLLAIVCLLNKAGGWPHTWRWAVLSAGFFYLSYDEAFQIHEQLVVPIRALLGNPQLGIFYDGWVIPALLALPLIAWFFRTFLLHLPATTRWRFVLAGAVYLTGAIGFELLGGRYVEAHGTRNLTYTIFSAFEETLEMAGVILFIRAVLLYIEEQHRELRFRFVDADREQTGNVSAIRKSRARAHDAMLAGR